MTATRPSMARCPNQVIHDATIGYCPLCGQPGGKTPPRFPQ